MSPNGSSGLIPVGSMCYFRPGSSVVSSVFFGRFDHYLDILGLGTLHAGACRKYKTAISSHALD